MHLLVCVHVCVSVWCAGLDEYVYGGPRTHTQIETVKVKDIAVPTWFVLEEDSEKKSEPEKVAGGRLSRSMAVGSKYAKAKPAARSNGHAHDESSDEDTDDEVYLQRHRPFEEQEVRFRYDFRIYTSVRASAGVSFLVACVFALIVACVVVSSLRIRFLFFSFSLCCRHPKQQEREKNHKEALKKEGSVYNTAEDAYKSLW